ncbi:hypothetical protein BHM03_00059086 [Ensete ventricosum]|nr:hypothetical protein BHM03_00059086 [Ensete ventricosum]
MPAVLVVRRAPAGRGCRPYLCQESLNSKSEIVTTRVRARNDIIAFQPEWWRVQWVSSPRLSLAPFLLPTPPQGVIAERGRSRLRSPARRRSRRVSSASVRGKADNNNKKKLLCWHPFHLNPNEVQSFNPNPPIFSLSITPSIYSLSITCSYYTEIPPSRLVSPRPVSGFDYNLLVIFRQSTSRFPSFARLGWRTPKSRRS